MSYRSAQSWPSPYTFIWCRLFSPTTLRSRSIVRPNLVEITGRSALSEWVQRNTTPVRLPPQRNHHRSGCARK